EQVDTHRHLLEFEQEMLAPAPHSLQPMTHQTRMVNAGVAAGARYLVSGEIGGCLPQHHDGRSLWHAPLLLVVKVVMTQTGKKPACRLLKGDIYYPGLIDFCFYPGKFQPSAPSFAVMTS